MTSDDKKEFARLIHMLATTFRVDATEDLAEAYWIALSDQTLGEIKFACEKAMKTSEFMPAPARLIKLIREEVANRNITASALRTQQMLADLDRDTAKVSELSRAIAECLSFDKRDRRLPSR